MYNRVRRSLPEISGSPLICLFQQAVQILAKEGRFFSDLFHGWKMSGPLYPKLSTCFEGARLTQLVQLVTAGRLFPCHKGRVDLSNR